MSGSDTALHRQRVNSASRTFAHCYRNRCEVSSIAPSVNAALLHMFFAAVDAVGEVRGVSPDLFYAPDCPSSSQGSCAHVDCPWLSTDATGRKTQLGGVDGLRQSLCRGFRLSTRSDTRVFLSLTQRPFARCAARNRRFSRRVVRASASSWRRGCDGCAADMKGITGSAGSGFALPPQALAPASRTGS
jgi:hypothetical protein